MCGRCTWRSAKDRQFSQSLDLHGNPFHVESSVLSVRGPSVACPASVQKLPDQAQQSAAGNDGNNTKLEPEDGHDGCRSDKQGGPFEVT